MFRTGCIAAIIAFCFCSGLSVSAQKIVYSEPDRDDTRRLNFEIAGKVSGRYLIYLNNRGKSWINIYDNEMKQVDRVEQDYIPDNDKLINVDAFAYSDFVYLIYQYQKKNVVYCKASKVDGNGKLIGEVIELDTTHLGFASNNRIYTSITSEDKSKISVFKINSRNRNLFKLTTLLFNDKLELQKRSRIDIPMEERNDYLGDFFLDNDGDLAFTKFYRGNNDNITKAWLAIKYAAADSVHMRELPMDKLMLDEILVKIDNYNKRYLLASFYYKEKRGSIDGYYFYMWDKINKQPSQETTIAFTDEQRNDAKGNVSSKTAFNDHFVRQIIIRKDGGFIVGSESFYTTSRFNNWNRWDYLYGSPFASPLNSYYFSPFYNRYWWNRTGSQAVRYHADNITVMSFSSDGKPEWFNAIGKSQFDDESDDAVSYLVMNTGGQLHFLFNNQERRNNFLTDYAISGSGQLTRNPTLKNLDRGHLFLTKYGKQVSAKQMIIPCMYRNYICFAKVDYN
jgi:hypothetical protein